jgi:CDP-diacylglycerol--serine O-phosphatidyltransferase
LFLLWLNEKEFATGRWRNLLPVILVFLSVMMVSEVKYPSFKSIDWRTKHTFTRMVVAVLFIGFFVSLRNKVLPWALPIIFTSYLVYGFVRPYISRTLRRRLEDEDDTDPSEP